MKSLFTIIIFFLFSACTSSPRALVDQPLTLQTGSGSKQNDRIPANYTERLSDHSLAALALNICENRESCLWKAAFYTSMPKLVGSICSANNIVYDTNSGYEDDKKGCLMNVYGDLATSSSASEINNADAQLQYKLVLHGCSAFRTVRVEIACFEGAKNALNEPDISYQFESCIQQWKQRDPRTTNNQELAVACMNRVFQKSPAK